MGSVSFTWLEKKTLKDVHHSFMVVCFSYPVENIVKLDFTSSPNLGEDVLKPDWINPETISGKSGDDILDVRNIVSVKT